MGRAFVDANANFVTDAAQYQSHIAAAQAP
jgi:hypothetical protein